MNTNPDDWWLRRRLPSVTSGDLWSGGGEGYRRWMGVKPRRDAPEWPPNPRAVRFVRRRGRSLRRRSLAWGATGLFVVVVLSPLVWSWRLDPCAAAEVALVGKAISRDGGLAASRLRVANWTDAEGRLLSHGRIGRDIAEKEYAEVPPAIGCTALFWRARWHAASSDGVTAAPSPAGPTPAWR